MVWTERELDIFQNTSRVSSVLSLLGASFIILTFCTSKSFHRPINRLAFFAAFGNIITNVATITSRDGIRAGVNSPLCQAQATIIQWAIPADALFCLAMALNVYLTVFKKWTTQQLRTLEPIYVGVCYGVPLIVALVFAFIRPKGKSKIYGEATLWCWISPDWTVLRIAGFYGPVWIVLAVTFFIYVLAGRVILKFRRNLRVFARPGRHSRSAGRVSSNNPPPALPKETIKINYPQVPGRIAVTETLETYEFNKVEFRSPYPQSPEPLIEGRTTRPTSRQPVMFETQQTAYSCTVEATVTSSTGNGTRPRTRNPVEANTAAWAYCRCAMLFFLALVITWLPSSINRVDNLRHPGATHFEYNLGAAMVLPCQGFWNGLIYIVTTFPACKQYFHNIFAWFRSFRKPKDRLLH